MTLEEKREVLKTIFTITDIADQRTKDKIEGVIIGATLREHEKEILNGELYKKVSSKKGCDF